MFSIQRFSFSLFALSCLLLFTTSFAQVLVRDIPAPAAASTSLTFDGENFWSGDNNSNRIIKFSPANGAVLDTVFSPVNGSDGLSLMVNISGQFQERHRGVKFTRSIRSAERCWIRFPIRRRAMLAD